MDERIATRIEPIITTITLTVGIALFPLALALKRAGITLPLHRLF